MSAGPLETISVDGREFQAVGDASPDRILGGYTNEILINGNQKTHRTLKTPTPWSMADSEFECNDELGDQEYLAAKQASDADLDLVYTYASGSVYQGVGQITGDLAQKGMTETVSFGGGGSGELKKMG
jgi:hypothetical protein